MTVLTPGASAWVVATRVATLDVEGYVDPGAATYVTEQLMKLTLTPVLETGDEIAVKNASGNLSVFAKHGDMAKWYKVMLELAIPDPALEQICAGGTLYTASSSALGTPTGLTVVPQITLGSLAAGVYGYRTSQYNAYGESLAEADVAATVASGTTGANVISATTMASGALGVRVYGRTIGIEQYLGSYPNIGTQATKAASGTGTVTSLTVTALTESIPKGTKFQIEGDTNTVKIVFTTTAFAPKGVVALPVEVSQSVTTTIASGNIIPVFVDTGVITPSGNLPQEDQTAGPGENVGYQAPEFGPVANEKGVSVECWSKNLVGGVQSTKQPFIWWAIPRVANMHIQPRDLNNANAATILEGEGFQNPNWGTGPAGQWPFDSTKVYQRFRCGRAVVPKPSFEPALAVA